MTRKQLILIGSLVLVIINGSIFGTIYIIDYLAGPSSEEIAEQQALEKQAAVEAIYAKLPPLEEFKSKANFLRSIGEAIAICENKLHEAVTLNKSWEVNMIESRYDREQEVYKIFMLYQTISTQDKPAQKNEVTCEVSAESKNIDVWNISPARN
jgi:hypothetical protein